MKHSHQEKNVGRKVDEPKQQPAYINHSEANEALELVKQPFHEMEKHARIAGERLRDFLDGLSKEDMIDKINQLNLSDKHLNYLCEGIILDEGDGKIIVALEECKKVRPANLIDDPVDHLNYTAY